MIRVYVAAPYTGDPEANTVRAIAAANFLSSDGCAVFVPHLFHYWHERHPKSYSEWMGQCTAWLEVCHALVRLPGASPGADVEMSIAEKLELPIFYSLEAAAEWIKAKSK